MNERMLAKDVGDLEKRAGEQGQDITRFKGFMSGLLLVRKGFNDPEDADRTDPFMLGYKDGEKARAQIVEQAVATVAPNYNSTLQLQNLVEEAEALLSAIDTGHFNTDAMTTQVARARVHLADAATYTKVTEYVPPWQGDDRLLAYFGTLRRAAEKVLDTPASVDAHSELRDAIPLPPDLEAAVEGPRGRHERP